MNYGEYWENPLYSYLVTVFLLPVALTIVADLWFIFRHSLPDTSYAIFGILFTLFQIPTIFAISLLIASGTIYRRFKVYDELSLVQELGYAFGYLMAVNIFLWTTGLSLMTL